MGRESSPIDDYLRAVPEDRRGSLEDLRKTIRLIVPDAEECISYQIPAFRVQGGVVAGFKATKKGCSYYPFSGSVLKAVERYIRSYDQTKSALHFSAGTFLPTTLVRRLVRCRISEIRSGRKSKTSM
jgi:uncharacterized protein YdhG (YjbR/CyaY superfamily)